MFEVEKKFRVHYDNVKPLVDSFLAKGYRSETPLDTKTFYLDYAKTDILRICVVTTAIGETRSKTRYLLGRKWMQDYEYNLIKKKERWEEEEEITKFTANQLLRLASNPLNIVKFRTPYRKKAASTLISNDFNLVKIDLDEVRGLGNRYDGVYVEFEVEVEDSKLIKKAYGLIDTVVEHFRPFVGEYEQNSYIEMLKKSNRELL